VNDKKTTQEVSTHPELRFAGSWNPNDSIYEKWLREIKRNRRLREQLGDAGFYDYLLNLGRENEGDALPDRDKVADEAREE
jgi:hypothetical protein